jgi:hypothetical protein
MPSTVTLVQAVRDVQAIIHLINISIFGSEGMDFRLGRVKFYGLDTGTTRTVRSERAKRLNPVTIGRRTTPAITPSIGWRFSRYRRDEISAAKAVLDDRRKT